MEIGAGQQAESFQVSREEKKHLFWLIPGEQELAPYAFQRSGLGPVSGSCRHWGRRRESIFSFMIDVDKFPDW